MATLSKFSTTANPNASASKGIDCPERGQAFANRAKQTASAVVFEREGILQTHGQDKYARTRAYVLLPDGTNVNHALVKGGWCRWHRKYAPGKTVLEQSADYPYRYPSALRS
jgi:endonuclease YncB( thermonuclease family)